MEEETTLFTQNTFQCLNLCQKSARRAGLRHRATLQGNAKAVIGEESSPVYPYVLHMSDLVSFHMISSSPLGSFFQPELSKQQLEEEGTSEEVSGTSAPRIAKSLSE